jgi:hypothetical protein
VRGCTPPAPREIVVDGQVVGAVGEIDPDVLVAFEVPGRVAWFDLDLTASCSRVDRPARPYEPVRLFPSSDLDLAFEVDEAVPAGPSSRSCAPAAGDLLVDLELFDVFRGRRSPRGRRSLAWRLRLQAADRTLTDAELAEVRTRGASPAVEGRCPPRCGADARKPADAPSEPTRRCPGPGAGAPIRSVRNTLLLVDPEVVEPRRPPGCRVPGLPSGVVHSVDVAQVVTPADGRGVADVPRHDHVLVGDHVDALEGLVALGEVGRGAQDLELLVDLGSVKLAKL